MSEQLTLVAPATLTIDCPGEPIPQGSMIAVKRGKKIVLVSDNPALRKWRDSVVNRIKARMVVCKWATLDGPVNVTIDFWLTRPAAAKNRPRPCVRPDVDKLARAVLDALTQSQAIVDDSRVVRLVAEKHYGQALIGCRIVVTEVTDR